MMDEGGEGRRGSSCETTREREEKGKKEGVRRRVLKRELGRGAPREGEVRILGGLMIFSCSPLGGDGKKTAGKAAAVAGQRASGRVKADADSE